MEQKLASLLRVLSAVETQIDIVRASLTKSSKEAFQLIDTCGRNILSSFEISQFLEKHKIKLEQDEVRMIVQYYDISRKGKLDLDSFEKALTPRNKQSTDSAKSKGLEDDLVDFLVKELDLIRKTQTLRVQLIQAAQSAKTDVYKVIDNEDKGVLASADIERFLQRQGARPSAGEMKAILQRGDRNGNGVLTEQEFEAWIVPDVTTKKVLAKQPDLTMNSVTEIPRVLDSYTALKHAKVEQPQVNAYSYSQTPKHMPSSVMDTPLTVSQVVDKYTQPKYGEYNPTDNYRPYSPTRQSTLLPSSNTQNLRMSSTGYSSTYPSSQATGSYTPYAPGMYSNPKTYSSQSRPILYDNPSPVYSATVNNDYMRSSQYSKPYSSNTNVIGQTGYRRGMNKSMSSIDFNVRSPAYDRGYQNFSPSRYNYHREPRDVQTFTNFHRGSRYEHSPHRSPGYGDFTSASPPTRYGSRFSYESSPTRDYYQPQYLSSYGRREDPHSAGHSFAKRTYEGSGYGCYEPVDHLKFTSDMLNRSNMAYSSQRGHDWGVGATYSPHISPKGVGLYDRDQLKRKYDNLTRRNNIYA